MDGIAEAAAIHEGRAEPVTLDEKAYVRTGYTVDFGTRNGTARVTVLDPCVTEEARERRRQAVLRTCGELMGQGLL